jgi:hypothetical protein
MIPPRTFDRHFQRIDEGHDGREFFVEEIPVILRYS